MRDVNASRFSLLSGPADWGVTQSMMWAGDGATLAGQQAWRLPSVPRAAALAALAASQPLVVDGGNATARIAADGATVEAEGGAGWTALRDLGGAVLAPKIGRFVAMALGGGRLALVATDGATAFLQLFDLRERWGIDAAANPAVPLALDPAGAAIAVAADGTIYAVVTGGLAVIEGGPVAQIFARPTTRFEPVAANRAPLRQTALIAGRPPGVLAIAVDGARVALLCDAAAGPQTLALLDRKGGGWTTLRLAPADGTILPFLTDVGLLGDGLVALMAPLPNDGSARDCAVVTLAPPGPAWGSVAMAPFRYPMLDQVAPRFAAIPGPDVRYLAAAGPRPLLALPHPSFATAGGLGCFGLAGNADLVWHRLYIEASLPPGTGLAVWARAAEQAMGAADQSSLLAAIIGLSPDKNVLTGADVVADQPLADALNAAPFHRQPPLTASPLASEIAFHAGFAGGLHELLLQRSAGANRRLQGAALDLVLVATGDGRHAPCIHAVRVYAPRFCYQDEYLPALFHQTAVPDEADQDPVVSPPDFRERLLGVFEGMLTPLEGRVAAAELLLDPWAAPARMLPWLASYLGRTPDPGWPEARRRRAIATAGLTLRRRGTYRGVCLALDVATDGAVARGEIVLVETHRLRRTAATILGVAMGGRNPLTEDGVPSGNSVVGDTLVLSAERAREVLALLTPGALVGADAATVSAFLDEYADRVQVAALLHQGAAGLRDTVQAVLTAELPAQLRFEILTAESGFILGLAPLLGIDTFLEPTPPPAALTLDRSVVGRDAVVRDAATLLQ